MSLNTCACELITDSPVPLADHKPSPQISFIPPPSPHPSHTPQSSQRSLVLQPMVVSSSYDALQRCEQVRKLWDSMKILLAKERSHLDHALAKVMEAKGKDGPGEEEWRYVSPYFSATLQRARNADQRTWRCRERRNARRQALITFVERAQTEWRWRLRVARLEESDWTSGNITEKERAVVEAIMAMPRYIDDAKGNASFL